MTPEQQLSIYNGALLLCGERALASLSVNEESRHNLDQVWGAGGVRACLEQGQWRFAMRTSQLAYSTTVTPAFGYARAFEKPSDWVQTVAVSADERLENPLLRYQDEAGYWWADEDTLYVRYISDATTYGGDYTKWPVAFREFVHAYFASRIVHKTTASAEMVSALMHPDRGILTTRRRDAKNHAAAADPVKFPPRGSWSRARGGGNTFQDGGSNSTLIG